MLSSSITEKEAGLRFFVIDFFVIDFFLFIFLENALIPHLEAIIDSDREDLKGLQQAAGPKSAKKANLNEQNLRPHYTANGIFHDP